MTCGEQSSTVVVEVMIQSNTSAGAETGVKGFEAGLEMESKKIRFQSFLVHICAT